jgi:polyhydroxybutyrate depolymerase
MGQKSRSFLGLGVLIFAFLTGPVAARQDEPVTGLIDGSLVVDGTTRTYLLHVPPQYDPKTPMPLLVVYHGGLRDGQSAAASYGLNATADKDGFIVAYPNGLPKTGGHSTTNLFWNSSESSFTSDADDIAFTEAFLDLLESKYAIDPDRIFATGMSNGAQMDYRVACDLANRFAAVAPVSGSLETDPCTPSSPVSIIDFHGTKDPLVKFNGGGLLGFQSHAYTIGSWVKLDGCSATPQVTNLPVLVNDGTSVTVSDYGTCAEGSSIVGVVINGGGHNWPQEVDTFPYLYGQTYLNPIEYDIQRAILGKITHQISANDMMWNFFVQHPKTPAGQ